MSTEATSQRPLYKLEEEVEESDEQPKKKPKKEKDYTIVKSGTEIILPIKMTEAEAITVLQRKLQEAESDLAIREEVHAFPLEGVYAFAKALKEKYGWAQAVPEKSFFGDLPPTVLTLEIGYHQTTQVVWGVFKVPGIAGHLKAEVGSFNGMPIFIIGGVTKQKHKEEIHQIAERTRQIVRENSIYKGQAIRLKDKKEGNNIFDKAPSFMDISNVNEEELVFTQELMEQVTTNLWTPIEKTEFCRQNRIPMKRGILLEGPYGTGKTLTAYVTAKKCVQNNWTFIYIDKITQLKEALQFASQYSPACIFAEDLDRVTSGERDLSMDEILNTIDGVESKGSEIITILTTNFVEKIDKAMLRPGRLDAVLSIQAPDAAAVNKLLTIYGRGILEEGTDLTEAAKELQGQIPAVIREVIERSKLYAINRSNSAQVKLVGEDLLHAAKGIKHHLQLMKPKVSGVLTPEEQLGTSLKELVKQGFNGTHEKVEQIHDRLVNN